MKRGTSLALRVIQVLTAGCYRTYMGYYHLPPSIVEDPAAGEVLIAEVEHIIHPLGFGKATDLGEGRVAYSNEVPITMGTTGGEEWERHRLSVGVDLRERLIVIQDLDYDYETPFVRSLKESIEKRLKTRYGLTDLRFEQHVDLLQ